MPVRKAMTDPYRNDFRGQLVRKATYKGQAVKVPFSAMWSSEQAHVIKPCPILKQPAWFSTGARGVGSPVLAKMATHRQRICALKTLCQFCGKTLQGKGAAYAIDHGQRRWKGEDEEPVLEGLLHEKCARYVAETCPKLDTEMGVYIVSGWRLVSSILANPDEPPPVTEEEIETCAKAVGFVRLLATKWRRSTIFFDPERRPGFTRRGIWSKADAGA